MRINRWFLLTFVDRFFSEYIIVSFLVVNIVGLPLLSLQVVDHLSIFFTPHRYFTLRRVVIFRYFMIIHDVVHTWSIRNSHHYLRFMFSVVSHAKINELYRCFTFRHLSSVVNGLRPPSQTPPLTLH